MHQNYFHPISLAVKQYAQKLITNTYYFLFLLFCFGISIQAKAQNGPITFTNLTSTVPTGLANDNVNRVYASGSTVYVATNGGLSITTNVGASFTRVNVLNGYQVFKVYASGSTVYAAVNAGLFISTDGGATFTRKTTDNGLGDNIVEGVYASGSTIYAATDGGLSISTDGGATFTNKTTANGLGSNSVHGVYASGSTVYAATEFGLSISTNGGANFTNKTTNNGLGSDRVWDVYVSGSNVYAATGSFGFGGVGISTDGGVTFTNKTDGLGSLTVTGIYVSGSTIYAATLGGLGISTNGGTSFTNKTTTDGLGDNIVNGVYVSGSTVYACTVSGLSISTDGCSTFVNKKSTVPSGSGLGGDYLNGVYLSGSTVYASTNGGLSISSNGGTSFTNKTTNMGLGYDYVNGVYASGSNVYAATAMGLSISTDGGTSFSNKTTNNGLGTDYVGGVYASGSTIYAATYGGLGISTDGGASFINKTTSDGLGDNIVNGVYVSGSTVYAATNGGLSISTDGGASFTNYTTADGLGSNNVAGVYVSGSTVYAATRSSMDFENLTFVGGGLSISTNGGASFTNYTTANGLGSNDVVGVYASGSTVYAATHPVFDFFITYTYLADGGLSISTNGGTTFTNYTTTNGLGSNQVMGVYASGNTVYAATQPDEYTNAGYGGLSFYTAASTCTPTSSTETISACGSYVWHGTTYTSSNNSATWTGTNAAGCDSVVTLNLTIKSATSSTVSASACGSYLWHGTTYTTSGAKTWTGTNAAGCDSVVTLNLTIKSATSSTETASACGSYLWHGTTYTTSGAKTWTGTNAAGCDSVVTLNLTITSSLDQPADISGEVNVCRYTNEASGVEYIVSPVEGATSYVWYLSSPATMKILDDNGNEVAYNSTTGYTTTNSIRLKFLSGFINIPNVQKYITAKAKASCGLSTGRTLYLTAQYPATPSLITSTGSVCAAITDPVGVTQTAVPMTFRIPKVISASSYNWYVDAAQASNVVINHTNGSGINDTVVSVTFYNAFSSCNLYVQSINTCGSTGARSYRIERSSPSVPGIISGPNQICAYMAPNGQAASYSVPLTTGVIQYNWSVPVDAISMIGQRTRTISFVYPSGYTGGTIGVTAQNACGTSGAKTLSVTRNAPANPSAIDVSPVSTCPNRVIQYSISAMPSGATYVEWTYPAGVISVEGQGTRTLTVTYPTTGVTGTITAKPRNECMIYSPANSFVSVKLSTCSGFSRESGAENTITNAEAETMNVKVFPNPTTSSFNVVVGSTTPSTEKISVRLLDVQGRTIKTMMVMPNEPVNLGADLKSGAYMLEVKQGGVMKTTRVVKY